MSVTGSATQVGHIELMAATHHKASLCTWEGTMKRLPEQPVELSTDRYSVFNSGRVGLLTAEGAQGSKWYIGCTQKA